MKHFRIEMSDSCYLDCYLHEYYQWDIVGKVNESHPAIIVCPGGGYSSISSSEAEPVALSFLSEGFSTFVLNYTVGDGCVWELALRQVLWAIRQVRKNAVDWYINPDAIAVMGFSAGGGMAGIASTQWDAEEIYKELDAPDAKALRPDAAVLCYGAMDSSLLIDRGIFADGIFGKDPGVYEPRFDPVNYINKNTPPTFLWHGRCDGVVPSSATLDYARKLEALGIPYELHTFDFAGHGMSIFNRNTDSDGYDSRQYKNVGLWTRMCSNWLMNTFGY